MICRNASTLTEEICELIAEYTGMPSVFSADPRWFFEATATDIACIDSWDGSINYLVYSNLSKDKDNFIFAYISSKLIQLNTYHFKLSAIGAGHSFEFRIGIINNAFDGKDKLGEDTNGNSISWCFKPQECSWMYKKENISSTKININELKDLNQNTGFLAFWINKTRHGFGMWCMDLDCESKSMIFDIPHEFDLKETRLGVNVSVDKYSYFGVGLLY